MHCSSTVSYYLFYMVSGGREPSVPTPTGTSGGQVKKGGGGDEIWFKDC